MVYCTCDKWEPNMEELNKCTTIADVHGFEYEGDLFEYCPWCGKKLEVKDFKIEIK